MQGNFSYHNPTKLYFGDKSLDFLKDELTHYGPTVMLNYGSGSVKRNGIYDQVTAILRQAGSRSCAKESASRAATTSTSSSLSAAAAYATTPKPSRHPPSAKATSGTSTGCRVTSPTPTSRYLPSDASSPWPAPAQK